MLINTKVLNIPPFISVQWNQIEYLTTEDNFLVVSLKSGKTVKIPDLQPEVVTHVFSTHATALETESSPATLLPKSHVFGSSDVKIGFSTMEPNGLGVPLQHMEELREAPNLPPEVIEKVRHVSKLLPSEDVKQAQKPIDNCNCPFCQISAAIQADHDITQEDRPFLDESCGIEVEIEDEELKFDEWMIEQKGEMLYEVKNKIDTNETYNVFLGTPVGCTCGKCGCEHILAVLKS